MPLNTRRSSTRLAPGWLLGSNGSITDHCRSENQNSPAMAQAPPFASLNHGYHTTSMRWLGLEPRCLVPQCGDTFDDHTAREALWARFSTAVRILVKGDLSPKAIGKLITLLQAQKAVLEED